MYMMLALRSRHVDDLQEGKPKARCSPAKEGLPGRYIHVKV